MAMSVPNGRFKWKQSVPRWPKVSRVRRSARATSAISGDPSIPSRARGKHAVFYRVTPDGELLIVRVLHAAMLPALHLSDAQEEDE
jgi:plasmid stabilization system protein ParE